MDLTSPANPPRRSFTPARIVALLIIATLVAGLVYLGAVRGPDPVSVPAGAHAGQLTLKPCTYSTEKGGYPADCGTLVVPENRADPRSRLIALPVTRIRARSDHPSEPIFRLEGGPGLTNMEFANASRFADKHDVVLVGYRGVDGSSRLDCPEVVLALKRSADFLGQQSLRAFTAAFRSCADRLQADGTDLAGYTLPQRVDDLDAARAALGYEQVDLLSESAGTRTALIYSWRHPQRIHRSVLIGANPPGHFLWNGATTDEQLRRYGALCAKAEACRSRTSDLVTTIRHTAADPPDHWGPLPIKTGNVRLGSFFGLMHATPAAGPLSAPMTLDAWLSAAAGDPSGLWLLSLLGDLAFPEAEVWGDAAAVARSDAAVAERYFSAGGDNGSVLGNPGSEFLFGAGGVLRAWPANADDDAYSRIQTSQVRTLVISGTLDFATPAENATRELLPHLPNGRQVLLPGFGHTTDFWDSQPKAGSHLVNTFLDTGRVDDSLYVHQTVDFSPDVTHTTLAKGVAATMVGFALVTVLSLLWMARRVRRGPFGPKASAALRSAYPLVLGLGGWSLGALIVMTTSAAVPLDGELLVALSVGAPIALGVYFAWVDRDRPRRTKATGFSAAVAGALLGAVLGAAAAPGLLALGTAIAGAGAGANLALIAYDVTSASTARPDVAPAPSRARTTV